MPSTDSRWTGQVSVAHLAQLSEATATIRDVVHFVAKRDEVILATRSDNDRCCVFGSTPVVDANETGDTTDGDVGKKIMVDARALADYFKSFETDVCELTVTSRADGTGGTITISDRSLTFNISFSDRRRWEGTFHEPEFQADLEGTATKLVSGLDLLSKIDSGYSEHVLLGVSDQVMCAYAWSELTEMVFGVQPSEVHTCSGPFHSIYPHDVLRESLSIFELTHQSV